MDVLALRRLSVNDLRWIKATIDKELIVIKKNEKMAGRMALRRGRTLATELEKEELNRAQSVMES